MRAQKSTMTSFLAFMAGIVPVLAGLLAGLGTGFAGLSAAVFIAPMLIIFLKVDSFSAISIALTSDVLASAASAVTYHNHGNTDLKNCRPLLITVLFFAIVGSVAAHYFTVMDAGESFMGWWLLAATIALGLKLLIFPSSSEPTINRSIRMSDSSLMITCGMYIGFVCGFQGTGGGLMLLFTLNILLGIEFKKSVGTSVCIMALTALIGAVSHFTIRGLPDTRLLAVCVVFTLIGAETAAIIANRIPPLSLKRITGGLMVIAGAAMLLAQFI